jgi:hypothetical protein
VPHQLSDWIAETPESVAARLRAANTIQLHTQFTIGLLALVSMTMLIASYNAYLSFDSEWVVEQAGRTLRKEQGATVADVLTERALQDWAESRTVAISLLGIRVSIDDAPVLGTASLFVISLWLFLLMRRENHTVGFLLRDTDAPTATMPAGGVDFDSGSFDYKRLREFSGQRWLIFHTILSNSLFVTFDRSLRGVRTLHGPTPLNAPNESGLRALASRAGLAFAHGFFFWLPVAASLIVFYFDRQSYFQPDPFMPGTKVQGTSAPFFLESGIVFFACWIPLVVCCWRSSLYSRATESVLREYGAKLRADLVRQQMGKH